MARLLPLLRFAGFFVLVAMLAGFALFAREASDYGPQPGADGDAIVALTGGAERVITAVRLLDEGRGDRLLISGVNPDAPLEDVREAAGASPELFDCCIDAGAEARDTAGNAAETARWARDNGYDRLIVVTSDYHMPRALAELRAALPQADFVPYGVGGRPPWRDAAAARRWVQEYFKYAAVYVFGPAVAARAAD